MKRYLPILSAIAATLCLSSCEKIFDKGGSDQIAVEVVGTETRGVVTDVTKLEYDTNGFVLNAFLESAGRSDSDNDNPRYLSDVNYKYDGSSKWTTTNSSATWRHQVQTNFWCYYPKTISNPNGDRAITFAPYVQDDEQKSITVDYTMPTPSTSSPYNDAVNMQDLLFAYATKKYDHNVSSPDGTLKITFQHILSAIMFKQGDILEGYKIKSICLVDVRKKGKCSLKGEKDGTGENPCYCQITWDTETDLANFRQDVESGDWPGSVFTSGKKVFWVIPQTFNSSSTSAIRVIFTTNGTNEIPVDLLLKDSTTSWKAETQYTYKISFNGITAVASLEDETNFYNTAHGTWDEITNGLEDYETGTGEWGPQTTVGINSMTSTSESW